MSTQQLTLKRRKKYNLKRIEHDTNLAQEEKTSVFENLETVVAQQLGG